MGTGLTPLPAAPGTKMFASGHGARAVGGPDPYQAHLQEGARGPHMSGYPMQHPGMAMSGGMQGQGQYHYMNQAQMGGDMSGHGGSVRTASQSVPGMPGFMQHHHFPQAQDGMHAGQGFSMHGGAHSQLYAMATQSQPQTMPNQTGRPKTQNTAPPTAAANGPGAPRPADGAPQAYTRAPGQAATHASETLSAAPEVAAARLFSFKSLEPSDLPATSLHQLSATVKHAVVLPSYASCFVVFCVCVCVCVGGWVWCVCIYVCVYTHTHTQHIYIYDDVYIHTHAHTHEDVHTHTHTHTHTHRWIKSTK